MKEIVTNTDLSSLNLKQKEAVISEDKRLLVLAGAGSGKTKTLIQRLEYLIKDKGAKTSEILAITFTKNATNEIVDRLIQVADNSGEYEVLLSKKRTKVEEDRDRYEFLKKYSWVQNVTISTFHSLCFKLVRDWGTKGATNNFSDNKFRLLLDSKSADEELNTLTAEETRSNVLGKILIEACSNKLFLIDFKRYLLDYLVDHIDLNHKGKSTNFETNFTSLNGTRVRSKSEQFIADWLYRHNIKYVYEPIVNMKEFSFQPDFFIPEANIYLEHISDLSAPMAQKEKELFEGGKVLIKTFESDTKDTAFFNLVLDRAIKGKLPLDYNFNSELNYEEEFKYYHKEINDFRNQVLSTMDMIKVENINIEEVSKRAQKNPHERVRKFYEFAIPLIKSYNSYCLNKSYQDFNDLIISAVDLMKNHESVRSSISSKYKYILVDEFQDVNNLQVDLLSLLLTDNTQLFCVGDDWQSIYGFRGSNVDYIVNFEKYYPGCKIIKLDKNYRSTPNIVGASNEVIKNNKYQIDKNVEAFKKSNSAIHVNDSTTESEAILYVVKQVSKLIDQGYNKEDILFLYRRSKMYTPYFEAFRKLGIFVSNKTIHASKGLEAKAVFIIGLTDGKGGFPDIWLSDAIFQVVKESDHDFLMEEERRLFYVAVTRAKDHLFLITQKDNPSRFIDEIPRKYKLEQISTNEELSRIYQCTSCNNLVQPSDKFCSNCGASLLKREATASKKTNDESFKQKDYKDIIIECIADLKFDVGVNYLAKILKGSKTVIKDGNKTENFTNFGAFSDLTTEQISYQIEQLIDANIIGLFPGNFGNMKVTIENSEVEFQSPLETPLVKTIAKKGNWIKVEAQKKFRNAYEPWTPDQDQQLELLFCEGKSIKELMEIMNRSRGAINARIEKLELEEKYL